MVIHCIRFKGISITNAFEQIQENTISGSAFSARLGGSAVAFIPDPIISILDSKTDMFLTLFILGLYYEVLNIYYPTKRNF